MLNLYHHGLAICGDGRIHCEELPCAQPRPEFSGVTGVYLFTSKDGLFYVGSSVNLESRRRSHVAKAARGLKMTRFGAALAELGADKFTWKVVCVCTRDQRTICEERIIADFDSASEARGYNTHAKPSASWPLGLSHNSFTKEKMRAAKIGKSLSPEHCAKISTANSGKVRSKSHCLKISAAKLGKPRPRAMCERLSLMYSGKPGPKHTQESRMKISVARMGMKFSETHRANLSAAMKLNPVSKETRLKMQATRNKNQQAKIKLPK
tara:strand:+ start:340 stop:1137 length:798 start_codon:yes stop_codon:yes gene_type:complete